MKPNVKKPLLWIGVGLGIVTGIIPIAIFTGLHHEALPPLGSYDTNKSSSLMTNLRNTINHLNGERHLYRSNSLAEAGEWIYQQLSSVESNRYEIIRQFIPFHSDTEKYYPSTLQAHNIIAVLKTKGGDTNRIIVLGAHYDTMPHSSEWSGSKRDHPDHKDKKGTPGANDNASGVAALLELARHLAAKDLQSTIIFAAFANEEPPFFQSKVMGSVVCAEWLKKEYPTARVNMISLESMAVYSPLHDEENKKRVSLARLLGLPKKTDYVAFMSNWRSLADNQTNGRETLRWARVFSRHSPVPVRTASLPYVDGEIFAWSDDWSFIKAGFNAFTITDTAMYRSDRYHELRDDAKYLSMTDYRIFAGVVQGVIGMVEEMANTPR